jgi:hypothetical protein
MKKEKSFTEQATEESKGQQSKRRDGSCVWYNTSPYFRVYFYPGKKGEKEVVLYRLWDSEMVVTGYNLGEVYKNLKESNGVDIEESTDIWQPASTESYVESIEHNDRP